MATEIIYSSKTGWDLGAKAKKSTILKQLLKGM
jgi:hypothetical protein